MGQDANNSSLSVFSVLGGIILAGGLSWLLFYLMSQLNVSEIYMRTLPVIIAVPIASLCIKSWQKGVKNLNRNDIVTSLAGGVGVAIGMTIFTLLT